jgi:hypothetical protein
MIFLNIPQLQRRRADIQTKVEALEQLNQAMRDRDKMKEDAIAHLSACDFINTKLKGNSY